MRKLATNTFVSLDGVMQAPGGPEEDPIGGFEHGGWSVNYWDDLMGEEMDAHNLPEEMLLGRRTYEIFAAHWPHAEADVMADALNGARKHVASTTLDSVDWSNSTLIEGDVAEYVTKLKQEDGPEIQIHGSAGLIQTLLEHDLIDEFRIFTFPLTLGTGKRLFGDGAIPAGLELTHHKVATTGVTIAFYERAGEIDYGSFALEEPTEAEVERRQDLAAD